MKRFWFVRHGESLAQVGKEYSIDSSLSERGRLQAEQLKYALGEIKFDVVYISPLRRARETYEYSGLNCDRVIFDSRLVEDLPQGTYRTILPYEDLPAYGERDVHNAWEKNSEERAEDFFRETLRDVNFEKILVISHSYFLNVCFQKLFLGDCKISKDFYMGMNNCGISSVSIATDKKPLVTLLFWNDISHVRRFLGYDPMKEDC